MGDAPTVESLPEEAEKRQRAADNAVRDAEHAVQILSKWPRVWLSAGARARRRRHLRKLRDCAIRLDVRGRARKFAYHVAGAPTGAPAREFWLEARALNDAIVGALEEMLAAYDAAADFVAGAIVNVRANVDEFEARFVGWQARSESVCARVSRWPMDWLTYEQRVEQGNVLAASQQVDERLALVLEGVARIRQIPEVRGAAAQGDLLKLLQDLDTHVEVAEKCLLDVEAMGMRFIAAANKTALTASPPFSPSFVISHWTCTMNMFAELRLAALGGKRRRKISRGDIDELVLNAHVGMLYQKELAEHEKAAGREPNWKPARFLGLLIVEACRFRAQLFPGDPAPPRDDRRVRYYAAKRIFTIGGKNAQIPSEGNLKALEVAIGRLAGLSPLVEKDPGGR